LISLGFNLIVAGGEGNKKITKKEKIIFF
jgi:hypothetical protein